MYDVEPFIKPVPFDFERAENPTSINEDLRIFRLDRSRSHMGQLVRENLGMDTAGLAEPS